MTSDLFWLAFSYTEIYPFNSTIFTNNAFVPAKSFSVLMHAPKTFPNEAPSSSPLFFNMSDLDKSNLDGEVMSKDLLESPKDAPVPFN